MRRHLALIALAAAASLTLSACGKKKEEAKKAVDKAAAGAAAKAKGAAAAVAEGAKKAAAEVKAKVAPPPEDVAIEAGDSVVAWLSLRSLSSLFDAAETIGAQVGALPPGASLREGFYRDLTKALADQGVTGHEWLDKAKPVHVFLQDDNPGNLPGGVVVMLPMTSEAAAKAALKNAKTGKDAGGHAAMLQPVKPGQQAPAAVPPIYVDFLGKHMVVTVGPDRFGKAKAFAGRIAALKTPSLAYLGVSIADAAKTRKPQIEALLSQFARMEASKAGAGGDTAGYYAKMMRQWVTELTRLEITVDGDANYVRLGGRLHATAGSKLAAQLNAGKGRDARPAAGSLPGNSFLSFVADMDPTAGLNQLEQSMKVMREMFKLDDAKVAELEKDLRAAAKLQTGESALAMYRDGTAAAGAVAWFGTRDPATTLTAIKNVLAEIGLAILAQEKARKGKALSKAEEAQFAVVERALKARKLEPVLTTYGPMAKEMGLSVTANSNKDGGASCEVLDIAMDWKKLAKEGDKEAQAAAAFLGNRTAVTLCQGKDKIAVAFGPSALEQGRRGALGKKGGLVDAPVYSAAAKRYDGTPSSFMYLNLGAAVTALKGVAPPLPVKFPADRPVTLHCGNRSKSTECSFSVPVQAIGAAMTLARGR